MKLRVTVTDAWDTVELDVSEDLACGVAKAEALALCVGESAAPDDYLVKFRGATVNEGASLSALGIPDGGALVVLPSHRQPVR